MTPSPEERAREISSKIHAETPSSVTEDLITKALKAYGDERVEEAGQDSRRMDWIDKNASFVCNESYNIGPYGVGELRKMADDGIAQDRKPTTLRENIGQG